MTTRAGHLGLGLTVALALAGCGGRGPSTADSGSPPFVFRSLDLRQQDMLGRPTWSLRSPEARYDMRRRVALADRPAGVIFRRGKPAFRLSAISGTVLNEGQVVLLEGRLRVEQLGERPLLIRAERARWFPRQNRLVIDRRPEVFDRTNRISAQRAQFAFDSNQLSLRGRPLLEHWSTASEPARELQRGQPEMVVHVSEADWNTGSGDLKAKGPVRGLRRVPGRATGTPEQTLTATLLEGNTVQQLFWLRAPVRFLDPLENTELLTGDLRFDLNTRQASSGTAFSGQRGDLQSSGRGFTADASRQSLTIASGCRLKRAGDSLQADSCSWNWDNQNVEARGSVQLRRQEHDQYSRGGVLSGRLGREGFLILTNPGGRVVSRLHLPGRPAVVQPQLQRPRPAAAPIRL